MPDDVRTDSDPSTPSRLGERERARQQALATVAAELAQMQAEKEAMAATGRRVAQGRSNSESVVFSTRLARDEAEVLRRRAAASGIGVTVLARSLIRKGLARGGRASDPAFASAISDLEQVVAALRVLA